MFREEKLGVLPSRFISLKYFVPLCASFIFGTERRSKWKTKGNKSGSIRKETDNKPGYGISVDQLQSYQPGLVPQFLGEITRARIWYTQVMVYHFSDLTYVRLVISTIQEETLAVNQPFKDGLSHLEIRFKIYHADYGRFSENDSDQKLRIPTRV